MAKKNPKRRPTKKPKPRPLARKKPARKSPAAKPAPRKSSGGPRSSWLGSAGTPLIDQYARRLSSFIDAMADGIVDESEVQAQERRVAELMRQIEPKLDDDLHARVTRLLCELTAYDLMQVLHSMHHERPQTVFQG